MPDARRRKQAKQGACDPHHRFSVSSGGLCAGRHAWLDAGLGQMPTLRLAAGFESFVEIRLIPLQTRLRLFCCLSCRKGLESKSLCRASGVCPTAGGLLRSAGCANLNFCAVERAERECVRMRLRDWFQAFVLVFRAISGWEGLA
jgi:hypothetical protein